MQTIQVNVINPKAYKLLQDLAELDLISLGDVKENGFLKTVSELREKAATHSLSLDEITEEVESVRANRYEKNKG
ncbi:MAG: hypothetical protein EOP42_05810 [Sphingobacteriaceae bacterium]|nr:MAG: hypothetical protein EOP42_05810 [Sphingobacteriaceae bacterium]